MKKLAARHTLQKEVVQMHNSEVSSDIISLFPLFPSIKNILETAATYGRYLFLFLN